MKRFLAFTAVLVLATVTPSIAQTSTPTQINLPAYIQGGYAGLKMNLTEAAALMPDGAYDFKPGSMPEVRTYGQILAHAAEAQFSTCADLKGVPNPNQNRDLVQELRTKAEVVDALAASFDYCDEVFSSLAAWNDPEFVRQGRFEVAKSAAMVGLLAHGSEMYGISTVYLRLQGLVPPSTERQMRREAGPP